MMWRRYFAAGRYIAKDRGQGVSQFQTTTPPVFKSLGDYLHFVSGLPKRASEPVSQDDWVAVYKGAVYHAHSFSPEAVGKVVSVMARNSSPSNHHRKAISRLTEHVMDSGFKNFSGRDVAGLLNGLVRLNHVPRDLFESASIFLQQLSPTEYVSEKDLGLLCNAFARAGIADRALFESLSKRIESQLSALSSQSCGNICHAFGKLGLTGEPAETLLPKICSRIVDLKQASPQELSNVLYSIGNLRLTSIDSMEPLLHRISSKMSRFNPVEVAAVSTALSKLEISDKNLMAKIRKNVETNSFKFTAYEFTAVLHAFSQLDVAVPMKLFSELAESVLNDMNSHTACIALCAFARVDILPPPGLLSTLTRFIQSENDGRYLVDVLFGVSRLGISPDTEPLLVAVTAKLSTKLPTDSAASINKIIFAINKLGIKDACGNLYEQALVAASNAPPQYFDGRQMSNILFSFAHSEQALVDTEISLAKRLIRDMSSCDMSPQLFASCIESLSRLVIPSPMQWTQLERRLAVAIPDSPVTDVRTVQALAHAGRLTEALAELLTKRMHVKRLSLSSSLALLHALAFAKVTVSTVPVIAKHCVETLDGMSQEQLNILCRFLELLNVQVFPLEYVKCDPITSLDPPLNVEHSVRDSGKSNSGIMRLSFAIQDAVTEYPGDKALFALQGLERARDNGCPSCVTELLETHFLEHVTTHQNRLELIARVAISISELSTAKAVRIAIDGLRAYSGSQGLSLATSLLCINSIELKQYLLDEYVPVQMKTSSALDVTGFIRALDNSRHAFSASDS